MAHDTMTEPGQDRPVTPPPRRRHRIRNLVVLPLAGLAAIGLGAVIGASGASSTAARPQPVMTVIQHEPQPGPTVTETAPAPTVTVTETPAPAQAAATIPGDGTFMVGTDIQPGTYKSPGPADPQFPGYWERLSGLSGTLDDIIANANPAGPAVVTIAPSDKAFTTHRMQPWIRIGS